MRAYEKYPVWFLVGLLVVSGMERYSVPVIVGSAVLLFVLALVPVKK